MVDELQEKNFIQDRLKRNSKPAWVFFWLLLALFGLSWGFSEWRRGRIAERQENNPFLQVTNRQLSLFLWSHPEFMRANAKIKANYLPGFKEEDKIRVIPAFAEEYAEVPPEVLFRYHIWNEYLASDVPERRVPVSEFKQFLSYCEEWDPVYWKDAPDEYRALVASLGKNNSSTIARGALPREVLQAFVGWKNFYLEGDQINALRPTYAEVKSYLSTHPSLGRNYLQNILQDTVPNYLASLSKENHRPDELVPSSELSSVFKVPYYNYLIAAQESNHRDQ